MLFGSSEFSKEYGKRLKGLSGPELTAELRQTIQTMSGADQRTRDRGSYLVLENYERTPETDHEELLRAMLEANSFPSRGVQSMFRWRPSAMPSIPTMFAIVNGVGRKCLDECLNDLGGEDLDEYLKWVKEAIAKLTALLIDRALECRVKETEAQGSLTAQGFKNTRKKYVDNALCLSIRYNMASRLARMCDTGLLNLKGEEYISTRDVLVIGAMLNDEVWLTAGLERVINLMAGIGLESDWYKLAIAAFDLVKEERFAGYRQKLFSAIYGGRITPRSSSYYDAAYLTPLAQMAIHFQNEGWQNQVYVGAMRQLQRPDGIYAREAYDALEVLAPVHAKSREVVQKTPRPARKFVLR